MAFVVCLINWLEIILKKFEIARNIYFFILVYSHKKNHDKW